MTLKCLCDDTVAQRGTLAGQGATWLDRRERGEGEKYRKREEEEEEREVGRFLPFKGAGYCLSCSGVMHSVGSRVLPVLHGVMHSVRSSRHRDRGIWVLTVSSFLFHSVPQGCI